MVAIKVSSCKHPHLKLRSRDFNFQSDIFPLLVTPKNLLTRNPKKSLDILFSLLRLMIMIRISSKFSSPREKNLTL